MVQVSPWAAQQTFTTTGTGTLTLGSAVSPDVAFSVEMADGDEGLFRAEEYDSGTGLPNGAWEVFRGAIGGTGTTLTRATVIRSSTGTSLINWPAGTKRVFAVVDTDPLLISRQPITPAAGFFSVGREKIAEFPFLAFKGPSGLVRLVQPFVGTIPMVGVTGFSGASFVSVGGPITVSGTPAAIGVTSTDAGTRTPRVNFATTATAGNVVGLRGASAGWFVGNATSGGGVFHISVFTQGVDVAGKRVFFGVSSSTAVPTNANPATLTNCIGIACIDGQNNWHIVFGGSAAQTPINLGADFPCRTPLEDKIQFALYWPPGDNSQCFYEVIRNDGAFTASGTLTNTTPGTTLPGSTTALNVMNSYWTNNATASAMSMRVSCSLTMVL